LDAFGSEGGLGSLDRCSGQERNASSRALVRELTHLLLDEWMQDGRLSSVALVRLLGQLDPSLRERDEVGLFWE
jgi:hypothetical protein